MPDCEFQSSSSKGLLCNCCKTDSTVRRDQLHPIAVFSPIGCEFRILFNRCCIKNYIKNSVLLYSTSSIHGTLRPWGGHWNQRFLAWNHGRWRSRLLVNRLPELVVSVGWNSRVLAPLGLASRYFETYPYVTFHIWILWKGCWDAKKDVTIALRFWERHLNRLCRMHELREKEPGRLPSFWG